MVELATIRIPGLLSLLPSPVPSLETVVRPSGQRQS